VIGPEIQFNVPVGFFNVALHAAHEWNHSGFTGPENFDWVPEVEVAWSFPFQVGPAALSFNGFFNYVAPKGKGNAFEGERSGEILTRPELMLDVGNFYGKKGKFEVGVAYEYWLNKFGNDNHTTPGALANTPEFVARVHF